MHDWIAQSVNSALRAVLTVTTGTIRILSGGAFQTDAIAEATSGAGVTISSLFIASVGSKRNTTRIINTASPYTVLVSDEVIFCDSDGGAITVALPAGVEGTHYKVVCCGTNTVTVDPNGTEELFGAGAGVASTLEEGEVIDIDYNATEGWY